MVREIGCQIKESIIYTVAELRNKYKLGKLLKLAGLARSTYYYQKKVLQHLDKYKEEKQVIEEIFHENKGRYGYRRITLEMNNRGYHINHKTFKN